MFVRPNNLYPYEIKLLKLKSLKELYISQKTLLFLILLRSRKTNYLMKISGFYNNY